MAQIRFWLDNYSSVSFNFLLNLKEYPSDKVGFWELIKLKAEHLYIAQSKKQPRSRKKTHSWIKLQNFSRETQRFHSRSSKLWTWCSAAKYFLCRGGMVKSNKASLGGELKKIAPIETELSLDYISLFDDMAKLRSTDPHLVKYLIIF